MTGDGTNDAPALAQADVGVAMNTGTQAAREAGNMVDLDSNPTKLIEIVEVGKQLLITRGALDDLLDRQRRRQVLRDPAGDLRRHLCGRQRGRQGPAARAQHHGPRHAALGDPLRDHLQRARDPAADPASLKGVRYRPIGASALLRRNLWIYGLGRLIAPFIGIKLIDLIVHNCWG